MLKTFKQQSQLIHISTVYICIDTKDIENIRIQFFFEHDFDRSM